MSKLLTLVLTTVFVPQLPMSRAQEGLLLMKEEVFTAVVRQIVDGDSLVVREGQQNIHIYLDGIDAPELAQTGGAEAKAFLDEFAQGQNVIVHLRRRGRGSEEGLARVDLRGMDLSVELVRRGLAWYCPRQVDDAGLVAAERSAQEAKRGIWNVSGPMPPWRYRGTNACWQERVGS
jgi:micrococcal nuclease